MNLKNYYYYYTAALSSKFIDDIMREGLRRQSQMAATGGVENKTGDKLTAKEIQNIQQKRKSEVVWLDEKWIYNEIHPYIHEANAKAGWNFDWDFSESAQFTKYGIGQYYGWHCDSWEEPYNNPENLNIHGKIRKLSVTISLSNPEEYDGGNLQFDFRNQTDWERNKHATINTCTQIRPRGSIIIFPSFVWHRVSPVVRGTRYSLVIWNCGKPFK
jgi:PKHD-type hydroxylase